MMPSRCLLVVYLLSAPALAQSQVVVPATAANADGLLDTGLPFTAAPFRMQQAWDATTLAPNVATITALEYRIDAGPRLKLTQAPARTVYNVVLRAGVIGGRLSPDLDHNLPPNGTLTLFQGNLSLPALPAAGGSWIPLPFAAPMTVTVGPGDSWLMIDLSATSDSLSSAARAPYLLDAEDVRYSPGQAAAFGSAGSLLLAASASRGSFDFQTCAVSTMPMTLLIGASRRTWHGVPLPFSLAPLGAPGESLQVSLDAAIAMPLTHQGGSSYPLCRDYGSASLPPGNPAWQGLTLYAQSLQLGAPNALGIATSQPVALHFPIPPRYASELLVDSGLIGVFQSEAPVARFTGTFG